MKVKMLVGMAGGVDLSPGDIYDAPEDEALRMIASRFAIPYVEAAEPERAVAKAVRETRARPSRKK
jgi:hypothetical protein